MHTFQDSLDYSHTQADAPWWEEVYKAAFHTFAHMVDQRANGWALAAGIDRLVILRDATVLKIDEKVRRGDWPDILVEYWSDYEHKKPGWVAKDLSVDYIAYAMVPSQTCYLLPFQLLRRAWKRHGLTWVGKYKRIVAQNEGYSTISVPVPTDVLLSALKEAMVVRWVQNDMGVVSAEQLPLL